MKAIEVMDIDVDEDVDIERNEMRNT